jgi:hypothetical protein
MEAQKKGLSEQSLKVLTFLSVLRPRQQLLIVVDVRVCDTANPAHRPEPTNRSICAGKKRTPTRYRVEQFETLQELAGRLPTTVASFDLEFMLKLANDETAVKVKADHCSIRNLLSV